MLNVQDFIETGLKFHGHRCPAMPLGLKAGLYAMDKLKVKHSQDKELHLISETGKGHAAGCFLDGLMTATGCTYGKSNIEKLYYNKMAFTLIDVKSQKAVRVSLKAEVFEKMLQSPFVEQRKKGVPPQDISPEIAEPLIEKVLAMPEEKIFNIGEVKEFKFERKKGEFRTKRCAKCGEATFVNKLDDEQVCLGCKAQKN